MLKQGVAHSGAAAHGGPGGVVLGDDAAAQADDAQQNQQTAFAQNITGVPGGDAHVDDVCHHQGDKQVKQRLQHFKGRGDDALLFIIGQVDQQTFQRTASFPSFTKQKASILG